MGDANDGIGWLLQCGIWDLFDPDIEGAAKNSCTHMLLSPFFSSSSHQRRTSCEAKGSGNNERHEQRDTLTSPLGGEADVLGWKSPHREVLSQLASDARRLADSRQDRAQAWNAHASP